MRAWKVQKLFGDVVYDLRNRGLLPVVILLLVGMIAVPILLSGGSSSGSAIQATAAPVKPAPEGERAVVSYNPPGLRNYKQRLSDQAAKNPFRINLPPAATTKSSQVASTATIPSAPTGSTSSSTSVTGGPASAPGTVTGHSGKPRLVYFHSVADLSFGDTSQPLVRHGKMEAFGSLPTQEAPVLIYLGSSLDGKHAYFSVSTYSSQLTGPGACLPGPTDCSLLALRLGETETMVYSGDGKTYALKINKINRVVTKKPPAS